MAKNRKIPDIREVLYLADSENLRDFLLQHARRSITLEVQLRAHLIRETVVPRGQNKYSQVLGLLIKHNVHGTIRLTKRSVQLLREICRQFVAVQQELVENGELREAWDACISVVTRLHLLMDNYHGPDDKLLETLAESYRNIEAIILQKPAPELYEDILTTLFLLSQRQTHTIYHLRYNAFTSMTVMKPDASHKDHILRTIADQIERNRRSENPQVKYWCAVLLQLPWASMDMVNGLFHSEVYDVAHLLSAQKEREALILLVDLFPDLTHIPLPQRRQWARWKFEVALHKGNKEPICQTGLELLEMDREISVYDRLRDVCSYELLSDRLRSITLPTHIRAEILCKEGELDELRELIRTTSDAELLIRYLPDLLSDSPAFEEYLKTIAYTYVDHHGGHQCTETISNLIQALRENGASHIASRFLTDLKTDYPERFDGIGRPGKSKSPTVSSLTRDQV